MNLFNGYKYYKDFETLTTLGSYFLLPICLILLSSGVLVGHSQVPENMISRLPGIFHAVKGSAVQILYLVFNVFLWKNHWLMFLKKIILKACSI